MSFYTRVIFPRLCDFLLDAPAVTEFRRRLLGGARGAVLEIGFGTGLNLPFYPPSVRKVTAIDPNRGMHRLAQKRIEQTRIEVEQRLLRGEGLPFDERTFDCAVSTFTLCSIDDVDAAVAEIYRVLMLGGKFLFLEHGRSPEPTVAKWQRRLNPIQRRLGDGCRLDRDMPAIVRRQPFRSVEVEESYLEGTPKTHGYVYLGVATK